MLRTTLHLLKATIASCAVISAAAMSGCGNDDGYLDGYEPIHSTPPSASASRPAPEEQVPSAPPREPAYSGGEQADTPDDPTVARFLGLEGPKPESWTVEPPPNQMVDTNYRVPAAEGAEPANINVFFFGAGMGGPVEDNIQRWAGQFRSPDGGRVEPQVENFEVDGMPVALVELAGQYQGMGDPQPRPDQIMLSAIIDAPTGRLFIRLVGDAATIEHHREDYMAFLRGLRRVNGSYDG